ncbi:plasmid pRiA4b ORF-3 family protein [Oceanobacillus halophilus]|nr:plasmid pRiA4b ORF-3 family protein [Oceanobacillus halophilus]
MLIQATKKVLDFLKIKPEPPIDNNPLFSWHANLLTLERKKALVLVNDKNRYTIVLYGLTKKHLKNLDELIRESIRITFRKEGFQEDVIEQFIEHSPAISFTKTKDRTTVSRLNKSCETIYFLDDYLDRNSIAQPVLNMHASRFLVGHGKNHYIDPNRELFHDLTAFSGKAVVQTKAVQMKITLDVGQSDIWRRLVVPLNYTWEQLHQAIQISFKWEDIHLHQFHIPEQPARISADTSLSAYIPQHQSFMYIYDPGDNWEHRILVEDMIENYDNMFPVCLEGEGDTPPEDVGGEGGYAYLLEVLEDKHDPEHEHMKNWYEMQGDRTFDLEKVNLFLKSNFF